jgi:hypothetical protein
MQGYGGFESGLFPKFEPSTAIGFSIKKTFFNRGAGVSPAGDTVWITERGAGKVVSIAMPK